MNKIGLQNEALLLSNTPTSFHFLTFENHHLTSIPFKGNFKGKTFLNRCAGAKTKIVMLMRQSIAPAIILKNGRKEATLEVLQLMVKVGQVCCYVK